MKTWLFLILFSLAGAGARAQYDPKAFAILETMSRQYRELTSFEALLHYSMVNPTEGIDESFEGKITVQGDKFRLQLQEQQIINDGATVWTYTPSAEEVVIDHADPDEISPSKFYRMYKKGYKYLYLGEENVRGKRCHVVDLVPESKEAQFFKIRMNIGINDNLVQSWTLFDRMGTQYRYAIDRFIANKKVSDSFFVFNVKKYPDAEVVDLR